MKRYRSLLALVLVFLLLIGNIKVRAKDIEESSEIPEQMVTEEEVVEEPLGRQWITGEDLGTALVVDGRLRSAVGSNCVITPGTAYSYGTWMTNKFTVSTETGSHVGFCAQPTQPTPSGTYKVSKLKNDTIKALVLFYIVPTLYEQIGINLYGTTAENYAYCHAAIGYVYSGLLTGLNTDQAAWVRHMVEDTQEILAGTHQNPKTTELLNRYINKYELYIAYNNYQDIVWVETVEEGKLKLSKKSANMDVTNGNRCYGLEGAVYGVYSDAECKTTAGTLTTTADGSSDEISLAVGIYYVQEITAPAGYAMDTKVYTVEIKAEQTTEVQVLEVEDIPQSDRAELFLAKIDADTQKNQPLGSGTLENAQFTIKYYDGYYDAVPENKSPLRTWVVKTDKQGYCYLDDACKVSGDEFYHDLNGNVVIPLGTVVIQETKAPDGYLINEEVFIRQITAEGTQERVSTYNYPVIPDNNLRLFIQKVEQGTNRVLGGVVFQHTWPDGTTEEIITNDEFGYGVIYGITKGVHTIKEVSAPEGYIVNPGELRFEILENGEMKQLSNTASEDTGKMTFSIVEDYIELEIENVIVPFSLQVHKEDEAGSALEGAEFTIYSDAECTKIVSEGTTDGQGMLTFSGLKNDTDYYLKETKATKGYRVPVNADGTGIIYKVRAKNSPADNEFTYYINEKEYTKQDKEYKVTGTKNEPVVNLTVVNYTGIQMPETGVHKTLFMSVLGLGCMTATLVYMINRRKNEGR